jgi:hypothetical protein
LEGEEEDREEASRGKRAVLQIVTPGMGREREGERRHKDGSRKMKGKKCKRGTHQTFSGAPHSSFIFLVPTPAYRKADKSISVSHLLAS